MHWAVGWGGPSEGVLPKAWMNPCLVSQPLFHRGIVDSTVTWGKQEGLASPSPVWVLFALSL